MKCVPTAKYLLVRAVGTHFVLFVDAVPCVNQATMDGQEHDQDEETFMDGGSRSTTALALLGGTGNAEPSLTVRRQATRQG